MPGIIEGVAPFFDGVVTVVLGLLTEDFLLSSDLVACEDLLELFTSEDLRA